MNEFDKWWEENYMNVSADRTEAEDIYNIGSQSQQAKIDELQARVDAALDMLKGGKGKVLLDDIVDTLKGNKDEK